jgi:hypothetical protein
MHRHVHPECPGAMRHGPTDPPAAHDPELLAG